MYFPAALSIGSDFWRAWALRLFFLFFEKSLEYDMKHDKISSFQIGALLFCFFVRINLCIVSFYFGLML